ncbi:hypothetical protein JTE90_002721 [Oedothorax gibbosus]|uniref:ATP synthase F0 subunit 8 n=1 Tax=Oedothorax gibbosus TaxID=931172 RepID=A0AAV6VZF1_9ARAC|nr:hypothetical protein JTE90_002721 [Oedothorax gibbosus]
MSERNVLILSPAIYLCLLVILICLIWIICVCFNILWNRLRKPNQMKPAARDMPPPYDLSPVPYESLPPNYEDTI